MGGLAGGGVRWFVVEVGGCCMGMCGSDLCGGVR